jgi:predicted transcriptional regulator
VAKKKKRADLPKIDGLLGPLEAEVMELFWSHGSMLVSEVEELLNQCRSEPLAYKTVLTICTRLTDKGHLGHEKQGRAFRYHALETKDEFARSQAIKATNVLLARFGDLALASFAEHIAADPAQLESLRRLLEENDEDEARPTG